MRYRENTEEFFKGSEGGFVHHESIQNFFFSSRGFVPAYYSVDFI